MFKKLLISISALALITSFLFSHINSSQAAATLPSGFTDNLIASGFSSVLTAMDFTPDGRIFVNEKVGNVRIVKNGTLLPTPFLTVPAYNSNERGLLGIAFDPNFTTNRYVYVFYTINSGSIHNRVSRFTANATNPDIAAAGSELVILDNIPSQTATHNGGTIHFGPDGKLYIGVGDNWTNINSQDMNILAGKMLRINSDGSIPADNPYVGQSGIKPEIWASGLRNPFSFSFQPGTGKLFINDVGNNLWEEINQGTKGANYGWPTCEGICNVSGMTNPVYEYSHNGGSSAITGSVFYSASSFPAPYANSYFFGDYVNNWIKSFNPTTGVVTDFATNAISPVDFKVGSDGGLYYLSEGTSEIHEIVFGSNNPTPTPTPTPIGLPPAPVISTPTAGSTYRAGDDINFSGSATDPEDGNLNPNNLTWSILFHHETHTHPAMDAVSGITSGSYHIPTIGETSSDTFYRIHLVAKDSDGNTTETTRDVRPITSNLTFNTVPAGLGITLDDQPTTTPTTVTGVVNMQRTIGAPASQTLNGHTYLFNSWSDGGSATHTFATPANDTIYTASYTEAPVTELVQNGSFDNTGTTWLNPWKWIVKTGAAGTFTQDTTTSNTGLNSGKANITTASTDYFLQLQQPGIPLATGTQYTISFWAKANVNRNIRVAISQTASPYATYTQQTFAITTNWTKYSFTYNSTVTQPDSMLLFNLAGTLGQVSLDDISVTRPSTITPTPTPTATPTPTPTPVPTPNMLINPSFETTGTGTTWLNPWKWIVKTGAAATISQDATTFSSGLKSANINITQASTDWYVQLQQQNVPIVNGGVYTISFWAKANVNRNIRTAIQQTASPYALYNQQTFAITPTWTKYTYTYTSAVNQTNAMFILNLAQSTGQVWIDDVSIVSK